MTIPWILWRPLKYTSEELEKKIEEYFIKITDEQNDEIPDVEWLALYLDTTRKTLLDYEKKEEFSYTIKRAKDRIFFYKKQLAFKWKMNPTIFIFDSKNNHDYTDKTEIDQTIKWDLILNDYKNLSTEELIKLKQCWI